MKSSLRLAAAAIVMTAVLSACGDDEPEAPAPTTAAPTATTSEPADEFTTHEVSEESDAFGQLTAVRVGAHSGFDRVVLEFADEVPGYTVKYVDLPISEDGSGEAVDLPGADAAVQVVLTPASGFDMEAGEPTYTGPRAVKDGKTTEITAAVSSGDFESLLSWAVGLRHEVPFKVTTLESPARLVIDFQTD